MGNIDVYLFDDCDYVATPWEIEETVEWYNQLTGVLVCEDYAEFIDIKKVGMWEEISIEDAKGKVLTGDCVFGNLGYFAGELCIYKSFYEVLKNMDALCEPEIIASREF